MDKEIIVQDNDIISRGKMIADQIKPIILSDHNKLVINGKVYVQFHIWQTVARFFKVTAAVKSVDKIEINGQDGYNAVAVAYDVNGQIISEAQASCSRDEDNWNLKPDFQLRSMAQTRACSKVLKNCFAWILVLAGTESTPAEEMDNGANTKQLYACQKCKTKISKRVNDYSIDKFGAALCYKCQGVDKQPKSEEEIMATQGAI